MKTKRARSSVRSRKLRAPCGEKQEPVKHTENSGYFLWNLVTEFITNHRWVFVICFVLPMSLLFDLFYYFRERYIRLFFSAPKLHDERVRKIQREIQEWKDRNDGTTLCTARGGWQSISPQYRLYKNKSTRINVDLHDILELDTDGLTVRTEPCVNMGQLSHFLIRHGFTCPILPEMDDLTVGGMIMGVGIETSSHKYGLFNDHVNVVDMELVMADGSVVTCDKKNNRDLYDAVFWSYGTLGFLVSVKLRIVPCEPYVKLRYIPCHTPDDGVSVFRGLSESEDPPDFVEALAYSKDKMVVMAGTFATREEASTNSHLQNPIGRWYKPWFYKHVESFLGVKEVGKEPSYEYIPLRDYYHRHTRSIFWELREIIPIGNHPVFRFLLGWAVPPKVSFLKLTQTKALAELYEKKHVIQDMLVPTSKMAEALTVFHRHYEIYPLWICPYRAYDNGLVSGDGTPHRGFLRAPKNIAGGKDYEMYVDLGAYGIPKAVQEKKPFDIVTVSHAVEKYVLKVKGYQMLYADSYLSRTDFRKMFDHSHYDQVKRRDDPENAFPQIYEKVCKNAKVYWEKKADSQ